MPRTPTNGNGKRRTPAQAAATRRARRLPKQSPAEALEVARRFVASSDAARKMLVKIKKAPVAADLLTSYPQSASKKRRLEILSARLQALRDLQTFGLATVKRNTVTITQKGWKALAKKNPAVPKAKTSQRKSPKKTTKAPSSSTKKTTKARSKPAEIPKRGYTVQRCTTRSSNHPTLKAAQTAAKRKQNAKIRNAATGEYAEKER